MNGFSRCATCTAMISPRYLVASFLLTVVAFFSGCTSDPKTEAAKYIAKRFTTCGSTLFETHFLHFSTRTEIREYRDVEYKVTELPVSGQEKVVSHDQRKLKITFLPTDYRVWDSTSGAPPPYWQSDKPRSGELFEKTDGHWYYDGRESSEYRPAPITCPEIK